MKKVFLAVFIYTGLFEANSWADIQFDNPFWSVCAENNYNSHDYKSDIEYGEFNERAIVSWVNTGDGVVAPNWAESYKSGDYFASAGQIFKIPQTNRISAQGFSEEWNPSHHALLEDYTQTSSIILSVNIVVDTPRWIVLNGTLNAWGDYGGTEAGYYYAEINLSGEFAEIYSARIDSYDNDYYGGIVQIDKPLFLDSGNYSFYAKASSTGQYSPYWPYGYDGQAWGVGGGGYAYFNIELIPEPATLLLLGGLGLIKRTFH